MWMNHQIGEGGGAVNIGNYSTPSFYYCTFDGNVVDRTGTDANSEAYGGAVFVYSSSANMAVLFEGCIFKNNTAKGNQSATGGALGARDAQVDILNCLFYGNTALHRLMAPIIVLRLVVQLLSKHLGIMILTSAKAKGRGIC
jgi:hypothetical protein